MGAVKGGLSVSAGMFKLFILFSIITITYSASDPTCRPWWHCKGKGPKGRGNKPEDCESGELVQEKPGFQRGCCKVCARPRDRDVIWRDGICRDMGLVPVV